MELVHVVQTGGQARSPVVGWLASQTGRSTDFHDDRVSSDHHTRTHLHVNGTLRLWQDQTFNFFHPQTFFSGQDIVDLVHPSLLSLRQGRPTSAEITLHLWM